MLQWIIISVVFTFLYFAFIVGDDWEHDEIFSDDEENTLEEIEDFATEVPAPPKFKQVLHTCFF